MAIFSFLVNTPDHSACQTLNHKLEKLQITNCPSEYYLKSYSNTDSSLYFTFLTTTADSGALLCGSIIKNLPNDYSDGIIYKLDKFGNKLWELTLNGIGDQYLWKTVKLNDGNYLILGRDGSQSNQSFLLKISSSGNLLWRKNISSDFSLLVCIKEDTDGSIILIENFTDGVNLYPGFLFIKLNSTGDFIFSKYHKKIIATGISVMITYDMVIKDGYSYVVGDRRYLGNMDGFLIKINNANGNVIWSKLYRPSGETESFFQILDYTPTQLCILGQKNINGSDSTTLLICDTSGNVSSYSYFKYGITRQKGSAVKDLSGNIFFSNYDYPDISGPQQFVICSINPSNGVIWAKKYTQLGSFTSISNIAISNHQSIICSGRAYSSKPYIFVSKTSLQGDNGCNSIPLSIGFGALSTDVSSYNYDQVFIRNYNPTSGQFPVSSNEITLIQNICSVTNDCDSLAINGPDTICGIGNTVSFALIKNNNCISIPSLNYDTSYLQLIALQNDTATFLTKRIGTSFLSANIITPCDTLVDLLQISIFASALSLTLGLDTSLCLNNTKLLNAHSGYVSYLWQDGSTDSTFTVTSPGLYWVEVKDACNNTYRDSINISAASPIPFDLGPDLSKCNNDSLTIIAPLGFLNYTWSPNYNINTIAGQTVIVFPGIDTMYKVSAEKTPGCFAYDSLRIIVHQSAPINLGADTSFCQGSSITLNAGTGFINYLWNTGETTNQISIQNAGIYSVIATDVNNCQSRDTLIIQNAFPNPVVTLPKDSLLCSGSQTLLSPGNGFTNYLWNTGSTSSSIQVSNAGTYWVSVTDNHGCIGNDTTVITKLIPVPSSFLPEDTLLCNYMIMQLKSLYSYKEYLWSNGLTSPSINISKPGLYWLQVKDNYDCVGKDSIIVNPKQCIEGFYIPTAFTPNNDGKNDIFRPLLFGNTLKYRFIIYNRWGQRIFETDQLQKGWDGKVNGLEMDSNVFVWVCIYQFEGQSEKMEKGTFVLIR